MWSDDKVVKSPAYWMNKLKIIDEALELEREYRYDLDKKVEKCLHKFKMYMWTAIITSIINIPIVMLLYNAWVKGADNYADNMFLKVAGASVLFVAIFTVPLCVVSIYKAFYYRYRCTYNIDPRDKMWKSYEAMANYSGERSQELERQRNEAVVNITTSRFEDNLSQEIDDMSDGAEPAYLPDDVMSFSELVKVMKKD